MTKWLDSRRCKRRSIEQTIRCAENIGRSLVPHFFPSDNVNRLIYPSLHPSLYSSKAGVLGNAIGGGRRRLNRNNTNGSILDRLGVRGRSRTRQAGAKQRASSRGRSASRNRLQRTSSRQNLTNGQQRGRSATRQKRGVSASLQQRAQSRQRAQPRQRSQSRARNIANAALQQNRRKLIRRRSRSNLRKVTSVNSRLGVRGPNAANNVARAKTAGKLVRRGRVAKPRRGNVRNQVLTGGRQQPVKRSRSR